MFSRVSVCPLGGGGVCLWSGGVYHTHTRADTPWVDTPLPSACWDTHPPSQCMLGYTHPCQVHAGIHTPLPSACWNKPPTQCMLGYGQQAGGTHPTGMHSCLKYKIEKLEFIVQIKMHDRYEFIYCIVSLFTNSQWSIQVNY